MSPRLRWIIPGAVVASLAVVTTSVLLGARLRSPEQILADAAPPEPSLVTADLERRVLSEPVVLRGQVHPGPSVKVMPPPGTVGEDSVITSVMIKQGQPVRDGMVLAIRSGQPLIALKLAFPLYRDLAGGQQGADVLEVQKALRRLGYAAPLTSKLDARTQAALRRFFAARDLPTISGSADADAALSQARAAADSAKAAYDAAVAANSGVATARSAWDQARTALDKAKLAAGPGLPRSVVVRVTELGATATTVNLKVGTVLTQADLPLLELNGGRPFVTAGLGKDQASLVAVGQAASIVDESTNAEVDAKVTAVSASSGAADKSSGAGGAEVVARIEFVDKSLPVTTDQSVRIDISTAKSTAEVLAAPVMAIYARADGSTFVTVVGEGGRTTDVTVVVGQIAGGWAAVTGDGIVEGARVVVSESANGADNTADGK